MTYSRWKRERTKHMTIRIIVKRSWWQFTWRFRWACKWRFLKHSRFQIDGHVS